MSRTSREGATPKTEPATDRQHPAAASAAWHETLMSVKKSLDEATTEIRLLRTTFHEMAPLWRSLARFERALTDIEWPDGMNGAAEPDKLSAETTSAQPQAVAIPEEPAAAGPEEPAEELAREAAYTSSGQVRPLARLDVPTSADNAPYSYAVTVEELGSRVRLVPLHQSLSRVEGIRQLSLRSYINGVAVLSVDSEAELEAPALEAALTAGMQKACRVMSGEGHSFLARMGGNLPSDGQHQEQSAA